MKVKTPRRENLQDPKTGQMSKKPLGNFGYKNATSFVVNIVNDDYRRGYDFINWSDDAKIQEEGQGCKCSSDKKEAGEVKKDKKGDD